MTRSGDTNDASRSLEAEALAVFAESLSEAPERRDHWLAQRCAGNTGLREAVRKLEMADQAADDGFLESPLAPLSDSVALVGKHFGVFEATSLLGAGGMGRVLRGRRVDGAFDQDVAIKCFDTRFASPDAMVRFEAERRILAALEHPGIARVIDGGTTEDGIPYLVMELIQGQAITDYCSTRALGLAERLRLIQKVCAAIAFAHDQGVVHRDLKPGNILVTADGEPRIIDFGIAKVLDPAFIADAAPETRTSAQMMTPEYASPEQVRGRSVSTASDIYALGIIIYELLTGGRPYHFNTLTPAEIERTICDTIPLNPSDFVMQRPGTPPEGLRDARTLARNLRGDVDRIVMTALRKEPRQRYASGTALADDIERYLGGHPVQARGASAGYRLQKFVQRNKAATAALVVVLATLVVSLAVVLDRAAEAERQRDTAQREAARATAAKDYLVELIGRSDPFENSESATLAGALRQSIPGIQARFEGQPRLEAEMRYAIGYALQNLGEIPIAREQFERAQRLWDAHGDALDQARVLDGLGIIHWWESDFDGAEQCFAQALARLGDDGSERGTVIRINVLSNLSAMRVDAGNFEQSLVASEEALTLAENAARLGWVDEEMLASLWGNRANALGSIEGREGESVDAFEKALALQIESTGRMHPNTAIIMNNLALTHYQLGALDEMARLFKSSLEIRRATLGPEHPQTATALFNLAGGLVAAGEFDAAEPYALEALSVARNGYAAGHPRIGKAHEKLAQVYLSTDRVELARTHATAALEIYRAAKGVDPAWVATVEDIIDALPTP